MKKKYLSDFLEADDIKRIYGDKVCIVSGVGSGKNTLIEEKFLQSGKVLLVTSRRSKVDSTINTSGFEAWYAHNTEEGIPAENFAITNYKLEKLIRERLPSVFAEIIGTSFDYLVIDEAHSLVTDATFTDSSFYIMKLIKELEAYKDISVVLMTGTYRPIKDIFNSKNGWFPLDYMKECDKKVPERIVISDKASVLMRINNLYKRGGKFIYLINSAADFKESIYDDLINQVGIPPEQLAVIMSDENLKKNLTAEQKEVSRRVQKSLDIKEMIPNDIRGLITTSKLKEGINIKNDDIKYAFSESHYSVDMVQFCGRVRKGIEEFIIINNAKQHPYITPTQELDYKVCDVSLLEGINNYLAKLYEKLDINQEEIRDSILAEKKYQEIREYLDYIHKKFEFIRFDNFAGEFELYESRLEGMKQYKTDLMNGYKAKLGESDKLVKYFKDLFGDEIDIEVEAKIKEPLHVIAGSYLEENMLIGKRLGVEECKIILEYLCSIGLKNKRKVAYENLKDALKSIGYNLTRATKSHDTQLWIINKL